MSPEILIVDDEADIRASLSGTLEDEGYITRAAATADEARQRLSERLPHLIILDVWLEGSGIDGVALLQELRREHGPVPVVMISGHGTIETAVEAIRHGASDFIEKPFQTDRLLVVLDRVLESARLRSENEELRQRAGTAAELDGHSSAIGAVRHAIQRAAPTGSRIFITGAPGSGKEVVARVLHARSRRAAGPFVLLNCATMRPERLEIELFGTEQGENGAGRRVGLLERAHGGTLLLDEVADMPLETQGKIVRALQDQSFERVGGQRRVTVDVRVIASTNRQMEEEIRAGRFRQDLFYRLNVVPIHVPTLAERKEDIPLLAERFMMQAADAHGLPGRFIGPDAMAVLQRYPWPGNVRQLRNVIDWLLIMAPGDASEPVRADQLPPDIGDIAPTVLKWDKSAEIMSLSLREARELFEREYLLAQVNRFAGNISRTAQFVGMERSALHRKLRALGVHQGAERPDPPVERERPDLRHAGGAR